MNLQMHLSVSARRRVRLLARALAPVAPVLNRRFRAILRERRYDPPCFRALLAITPLGAARVRTVAQFLEEVAYQGRRLAKLNVGADELAELLGEYFRAVDQVLQGRHGAAREQLELLVAHTLKDAYYQVREAE